MSKQENKQPKPQGNRPTNKQGKLKIIPLGGLGEVGKNMTAYEFGGQIIVVDAGIMFPENDMLGIDYIIPDYAYVRERAHQVIGIIITHGHEDHIGAITHVVNDIPAPVYATSLTRWPDRGEAGAQRQLRQGSAQHGQGGPVHPGWAFPD